MQTLTEESKAVERSNVEMVLALMRAEHPIQQREEFGALFKEHWDYILWKAKKYTKQDDGYRQEDAEDVASITFMKAFEEFASFDSAQSDIKTWLTNILRNAFIDWKRSEERQCRGGANEVVSIDAVDYDGEDPGSLGVEIQEALSDANWYQSEGKTGRGRAFLLAKDFKQESPKEIKEICERICTPEEIEILSLFNSGYSFFGISKITDRTKKQIENIVNRIRSKINKEMFSL